MDWDVQGGHRFLEDQSVLNLQELADRAWRAVGQGGHRPTVSPVKVKAFTR